MINRDEFLTELKEEQRFRKVLRKLLESYLKEKKQHHLSEILSEEQRIRKIIRALIKESKTELLNEKNEDTPHASTGINELRAILEAIKETSKTAYKRLTTNPDQRKAFIATWKWLFKAAFSKDMKLRKAVEAATERIDKNGFEALAEVINSSKLIFEQEEVEEDEEGEEFTMKVTDPKLQALEPEEEIKEPTEEEEHEFKVSELITSLDDVDRAGPRAAAKLYNATRTQVLGEFDQLSGQDAEDFYKWFFINMLGTKLAGFEGDPDIKPLTGHFQYAEADLETFGIETAPELLPVEDADQFNIPDEEF
tara:strand:- start:2223 stop:3149 length:927 start_codon:yes stop_codon:yes gene_type:complete